MDRSKVAIVVPTIEGSDYTASMYHHFVTHWAEELQGCHLVTVWDGDKQRIEYVSPKGSALNIPARDIMRLSKSRVYSKVGHSGWLKYNS